MPSAFCIGYHDIDEDHEKIILVLNELDKLTDSEIGNPIQSGFDMLIKTILEHFQNEEILMDESGYPRYRDHKLHHEDCVTRIRTILEAARSRGRLLRADLDHIFDILVNVVARVDLYFEEYLIGKGLLPGHRKPV